jgi:hypothetical protein
MAETVSPKRQRESIVGPESGPEPPFPLRMKGEVVSGFGRGSKEVCFATMSPTASSSSSFLEPLP